MGKSSLLRPTKRSPLIVKLKMPASASKPPPPAAASRRSHRKHAGDKALASSSTPGPLPMLATLQQARAGAKAQDAAKPEAPSMDDSPAGCAAGTDEETEEDGECWQPRKKSRNSGRLGKSRLRVSSAAGGKVPESGNAQADHPVGSACDELKARLTPSGTELDSQPAACGVIRPDATSTQHYGRQQVCSHQDPCSTEAVTDKGSCSCEAWP